jgi:hypothetical protein
MYLTLRRISATASSKKKKKKKEKRQDLKITAKITCSELTKETKSLKSDEFHQNCVCNELVSAIGNLVSADLAHLFC